MFLNLLPFSFRQGVAMVFAFPMSPGSQPVTKVIFIFDTNKMK